MYYVVILLHLVNSEHQQREISVYGWWCRCMSVLGGGGGKELQKYFSNLHYAATLGYRHVAAQ